MYAVEFEANIDNGIVHIPARYKKLQNSHAKIIIMVDEESEHKDELALQQFLDNGKKVDNITAFHRADLHDR
jgi:hypothetical protein